VREKGTSGKSKRWKRKELDSGSKREKVYIGKIEGKECL
jgi:hypothetical protein